MSDVDFHGWGLGGKALHIGELPGRKQTSLYMHDDRGIRTLAFFPTREQAIEALDMIDRLAAAPFKP